jgi:hypothetical protein
MTGCGNFRYGSKAVSPLGAGMSAFTGSGHAIRKAMCEKCHKRP